MYQNLVLCLILNGTSLSTFHLSSTEEEVERMEMTENRAVKWYL